MSIKNIKRATSNESFLMRAVRTLCHNVMTKFVFATALALLCSFTAGAESKPIASLENIEATAGGIYIKGWAYDQDASDSSIPIRAEVKNSEGSTYTTWNLAATDILRDDINTANNISGTHGFEATIAIAEEGTYTVSVYADDMTDDGEIQLGNTQTIIVNNPVIEIGNSTNPFVYGPLTFPYQYSLTQQIYTAQEIGIAGNIQSIAFHFAGPKTFSIEGVKIYLKQTSQSELYQKAIPVSDDDKVFEGTISATDEDWVTIKLDKPFLYDGQSNLLVCCYDSQKGQKFINTNFYYHRTSLETFLCYYSSSVAPELDKLDAFYGSKNQDNNRNDIRFYIVPTGFFPRPSNLSVDSNTGKSATMNWEAPQTDEMIIGYSYQYKNNRFSYYSWDSENTVDPQTTSVTITHMDGGAPYQFRVKALYQNGSSRYTTASFTPYMSLPYNCDFSYSNDVYNWTMKDCANEVSTSTGYNFETRHNGSTSFMFYHYLISDNIKPQYLISPPFDGTAMIASFYYKASNETFQFGYSTTTNDISAFTWGDQITADGSVWKFHEQEFPVGTRYVAVKYLSNNDKLFVADLSFRKSTIKKPANLTASNITTQSATLTWSTPQTDDAITGYAYQYKKESDDNWSNEIQTTSTTVTLNGLSKNTVYNFRVKSIYTNDESSYAEVNFSTLSLPTPANITASNLSSESATLTWNAPQTDETITGYAYQYKKESDANWSNESQTTNTTVTLNGLSNATVYNFRVKAIYTNDESSYAAENFNTLFDLPFTESFETGMHGWSIIDGNTFTGISSNSNHSGSNCFEFMESIGSQYLISPAFEMNSPFIISYYYNTYDNYFIVHFKVGYSTTTKDISAFTWSEEYGRASAEWLQGPDFECPVGTKYVAFQVITGYMELDDIIFIKNSIKKPANLTASNITTQSATLTWSTPQTDDAITGYAYQYKKESDDNWSNEIQTTSTTVTLNGLSKNTVYNFRVKSIYTNDESSYAEVNFSTLSLPTPANITASNLSSESATLTWNAPQTDETITGYAYQYKKESDANWSNESQTTNTTVTLNGLSKNTVYNFRVKTIYTNDESSFAIDDFSTSSLPAPADLTASNITSQSATLTWSAPQTNETITGYTYQYKKESDANWSNEIQTTNTTVTLNGLSSYTAYNFRVKAICTNDESDFVAANFNTIFGLPYTESFETGMNGWSITDGNTITGISSKSNHSGSNCFEFIWSKDYQYLISPALETNSAFIVSYYYNTLYDNFIMHFQVGYSTTSKDVSAFTWSEVYERANADWRQGPILECPIGTKYIAIKTNSTIQFDDFYFEEYSPYEKPKNLTAKNLSEESFTMTWNAPQTDEAITGYAYQYKKQGDANWSNESQTTSTTVTLNGLSSYTAYNFRVKAIYEGNKASKYASFNVMTESCPISTPYTNGFENGMDGWRIVNGYIGDYAYKSTGISLSSHLYGHYGFYFSNNSTEPQYLISPPINCNDDIIVKFCYTNNNTSKNVYFQVGYSTTTSDIEAFTWRDNIKTNNDYWKHYGGSFPEGTKYIAIKWKDDSELCVDEFSFESVKYNLYIGNTQVTNKNKDDVLNDGGKVKFDPLTNTLTLNNPEINDCYIQDGVTCTICSSNMDLTIKGCYQMTEANAKYGINVSNGSLSLEGDFTFRGTYIGIYANDMTLNGNITGIGEEESSAGIYAIKGNIDVLDGALSAKGEKLGLISKGKTTLQEGVSNVILDGKEKAAIIAYDGFEYPTSGEQAMIITSPTNAYFLDSDHSIYYKPKSTSSIGVIINPNITISQVAKNVVIERNILYDLWIGNTQVTTLNKDDILSDGGKAKYDPITSVLTLEKPTVSGVHTFADINTDEEKTATIYSRYLDLTLNGEYQMAEATADYGIVVETRKLTCDGRFTFEGKESALFAAQMELGEELEITSPTNSTYSGMQHVIFESDGTTIAKNVTIQPVVQYALWLGDTQVTTFNQNDIFGDGKASFDPQTGILTLDSPTISGSYYGVNSKIYSNGIDLTLHGRYLMNGTEDGVSTGLDVRAGSLTIDGDFAFYGTGTGVNINGNCTLMGGLKAVGNYEGFHYSGGENNSLTFVQGFMNAARLEVEGQGVRAFYTDNSYTSLNFTIPQKDLLEVTGGTINDYFQIRENDADSKHAVLTLATNTAGNGSAEHPYGILSTDDWNTLAREVANGTPTMGKYFRLYNEGVTVSTPIGTANHPFSGTFDTYTSGCELTLSLNQENVAGCAPFHYISGATIKGLKIIGSVTGGEDCAGLVGYVSGGTNLIENCEVVASISTYNQHCGGIIGHAGSATTTLSGCAFSGSIHGLTRSGVIVSGALLSATLVGQSGSDATLTVSGCVDFSDESRPIGQGTVDALTVSNTYYTYSGNKKNTDIGSWSGKAKLAYSVAGGKSNMVLTLTGTTGATFGDIIYAAENETVSFTVSPGPEVFNSPSYVSTLGTLTKDGSVYSLSMPAHNVLVMPSNQVTYSVTIAKAEHCTVVPSDTEVNAERTVRLDITPDDYYWLDELLVTDAFGNNVEVRLPDDMLSYSYANFTMPSSPVTVSVTYKPKYSFDEATGELKLLRGMFNHPNNQSKNGFDNNLTRANVKSVTAEAGVGFYKNCSSLLAGFTNCETMDLHNVNTSEMTSAFNLFGGCTKLTSLNLKGWDVANVTSMKWMFYNCSSLASLDLSDFSTTHLDLEGEYADNVSLEIFYGTTALKELTLSPNTCITERMKLSNGKYGWIIGGTEQFVSGSGTSAVIAAPTVNTTYQLAEAVLGNKYDFDSTTGVLTLNWGDYSSNSKWDTNDAPRYKIKGVVAKDKVRFVGDCNSLFNSHYNIESMDLKQADVSEMTDMNRMFYGCNKLTSLDLSGWNVENVTNMKSAFEDCSLLSSLNTFGWNTEKVMDMSSMFKGCSSMQYINISHWDTGITEDMSSMFNGCTALKSIDLSVLDVSNVGNMSNLFNGCTALESVNLSGWNTERVTDMSHLFNGCSLLTALDLSGLNTANVENIKQMFKDCSSLKSIDLSGLNLSKVTSMYDLFDDCTALERLNLSGANLSGVSSLYFNGLSDLKAVDLSNIDISNVKYMDSMFSGCSSLTTVNLTGVNTENVESMEYMFAECTSLTELDLSGINTSNVVDMYAMFSGCTNLKTLNLSGFDDTAARAYAVDPTDPTVPPYAVMSYMFYGCDALSQLMLGPNMSITADMELNNGAHDLGWTQKGKPDVVWSTTSATVTGGDWIWSDEQNNWVFDLKQLVIPGTAIPNRTETTTYIWKYLPDPVILIDNDDNSMTISYWDGYTADVTLSGRTLYKNNEWNTLCLPFSLSSEQIENSTLAGASIKELISSTSGLDGTTLTLNFTDATSIVAGRPYIIKWASGDNIVDPEFNNVTIDANASTEVSFTGGKFVGNYNPFIIDDNNKNEVIYLGSRNVIGYATLTESSPTRTLRSFRAHFELTLGGPSHAPVRQVFFNDDNTTEFIPIEMDLKNTDDAWYTIQGVKLDGMPTEKGLYIHNGSKVSIK